MKKNTAQGQAELGQAGRTAARPVPKPGNAPGVGDQQAGGQQPKSRRGWKTWAVWGCLAMAAMLAAAPRVLSWTPAVEWAAGFAPIDGQVKIGRASLGWFFPVELGDVEVRDAEGRMVVQAPVVKTEKSLLGLLCGLSQPGGVRIERSTLTLEFTQDSTNLEQLLAPLLAAESSPESMDGTALTLDLVDAQLQVVDHIGGKSWTCPQAAVHLELPAHWSNPMKLEAQGSWPERNGRFEVKTTLKKQEQNGRFHMVADGAAELHGLPLWLAEPIARRAKTDLACSGLLSAKLTFQAAPTTAAGETGPMQWQALATLEELDAVSSLWSGDRLKLAKISTPCQGSFDGQTLRLDQCQASCDWGQASLTGAFTGLDDLSAAVRRSTWKLDAEVDLAQAAQGLPKTLHLRDDVQVLSGRLQASASGNPDGQGANLEAHAQLADVSAEQAGQRLRWNAPWTFHLQARQPASGLPTIQRLLAEADFLRLEGAGSLDQMQAEVRFSLDRLKQQLSQLVDLGSFDLAGEGGLTVTASRRPDGRWESHGEAQFDQLRLSGLGPRPYIEPRATATFRMIGRSQNAQPTHIDELELKLGLGSEWIEVRNAGVVELPAAGGSPSSNAPSLKLGALQVKATGDVARALDRAKAFTTALDDVHLFGRFDLQTAVSADDAVLECHGLQLTLTQLQGAALGLTVQEPNAQLSGRARWETGLQRLMVNDVQFVSALASAQAEKLELSLPTSGAMACSGSARFETEAARLAQALAAPGQPPMNMAGRVTGLLTLTTEPAGPGCQLQAQIDHFTYGDPRNPDWYEPRVSTTLAVLHEAQHDRLKVLELSAVGRSASVRGAGVIAGLAQAMQLDLQGNVQYDLAELSAQMKPMIGENLKAVGKQTRPFAVSGSLASVGEHGLAALKADTHLAWDGVQAAAVNLGPGEPRLRLDNGWLRIDPFTAPAHAGQVNLAPAVRLSPSPMLLIHPQSKVIDHIHLTPEICAGLLQYAAPVVAGATEAEGQFSLSIEALELPLDDPRLGLAQGKFEAHNVRVKGATVLFELLAKVIDGPAEAQLQPNSEVPFRLVQGRVHHQNLRVVFPALPGFYVQTSGSVGVDQSLSLTAEMPIPPKWLSALGKAAPALAQQTIRIPITGTLSSPRIDSRSLQDAQAQFVRQAAGSAVQNELQKGLDKLFSR